MATDFDERAREWDDDPAKRDGARIIAEAIRTALAIPRNARLLEYGAGTGLVGAELAPHVGAVTLADASAGMRDVMADKIAAGGLPAAARIWDLDLTRDPIPDETFDLIVAAMTLHHIADVVAILAKFATLLGTGGSIAIVDLEREDGTFHSDDADFDGHFGFTPDDLEHMLTSAGFDEVQVAPCHEITKDDEPYTVLLATGSLPKGPRARGATR